jgi:hypothetical protein
MPVAEHVEQLGLVAGALDPPQQIRCQQAEAGLRRIRHLPLDVRQVG